MVDYIDNLLHAAYTVLTDYTNKENSFLKTTTVHPSHDRTGLKFGQF